MKKIYIDVTNIPELKQYTGISRVVSEIIIRLVKENTDIVPVAWSSPDHAYRVINSAALAENMINVTGDSAGCYTGELLTPDRFEKDSVFFEPNSAWHTFPNRSWLLPVLKNRNIRIVVLIHDIIPVRSPQFMSSVTLLRFMEFLTAHMACADDIVVTTHTVEKDVKQLFSELGMKEKPVHVIGLGADFTSGSRVSGGKADEKLLKKFEGRKFLLTVGSVEPRKNHKVVAEAYEKKIASLDTDVVFVGRIGWGVEELTDRIRADRRYNNGIYILSDVNDATLAELYRMAWMVVFPSYTEGYGLPTIEAMINGIPALCSDLPVMREVGGDFCDYFPADDSTALAEIVESYVNSEEKYQAKKKRLAEEYNPPRWDDTVKSLRTLLCGEKQDDGFVHRPVKQIVFLSARPAPLLATLPYIEEFMPFITELVVLCPDPMADFMRENYRGRLKLIIVTDDELLAGSALPADHATRNFFLRCCAMRLDVLDEEFIMSDDDYRPLGPVTEECFFKDGKYRGFYFSDLSGWKYRISSLFSYDYSMFRTLEFLKKNGFPTFQYSAHQPQIINRKWYSELLDEFPEINTLGYDEWSTFFNYCAARHPEHFEAVPYITLSWPNIGGENLGVMQSDYVFENFYGENYHGKGLFRRFSDGFTDARNVMAENEEKKKIALDYAEKFEKGRQNREDFSREYEAEVHMGTQFAVYFYGDRNTAPVIGCPDRYVLSSDTLNKLEIGISRDHRCAMNIMSADFEFAVFSDSGEVVCAGTRTIQPRVQYTHAGFLLKKADYSGHTYRMRITVKNNYSGVSTEKFIPVEIR